MPRPKVSSEMTTTEVAGKLGMTTEKLIRWVNVKVLPAPSHVDANGVRYFCDEWLEKAREIVVRKKGN